jgi:alkylhydroperoxidase/carboxymuconolactone decarboxylase family protein YurZ
MSRIALVEKKEVLPAEYQRIYDAIAQSRGVVRGPFAALLHSPPIAERTAHLGTYIRFESQLDAKVVELAALAAARELECKHEWGAHVGHAQKAGISMETVRAIHQRKGPARGERFGGTHRHDRLLRHARLHAQRLGRRFCEPARESQDLVECESAHAYCQPNSHLDPHLHQGHASLLGIFIGLLE